MWGRCPHAPARGMMPLDPHCRNTWLAMYSEMRGVRGKLQPLDESSSLTDEDSRASFPPTGFGVEPQIEKGR